MSDQYRHSAFVEVTEMPGHASSLEGLDMLRTRYQLASDLAVGKDVLDVSCGPGMGLGMLLKQSRTVTAGDFDPKMVEAVARHYSGRLIPQKLDALNLPFPDAQFDVVLIMESIYFMPDAKQAIREAARVLRSGGTLFVASANREYFNFIPAAHTHAYFSANEFESALREAGLEPTIGLGFPEELDSGGSKLKNTIRAIAKSLHLIPKNQKLKGLIKKLVGKTVVLPAELTDSDGNFCPYVPLSAQVEPRLFKVVYAFGRKS